MTAPLVITHPASYLHRPPGHPESPERIRAIEAALAADPDLRAIPTLELDLGTESPVPGAAEARSAALSVHDPRHVAATFSTGAESDANESGGWLDADTFIGPGSLSAACASLLSGRETVRHVLAGDTTSAFSFCRPPGHHATRRQAMGFCFFNNVAIAAQYALDQGLERVAIVDFDVHHGNGTQDIFYERGDVLYISTHQWPLYPGTGAREERGRGDGDGFTLNLPMPAGSGDDAYIAVFDDEVLPAIDRYAPELLLVSAGFDAHADDPLAGMEVSTEGFGALAHRLLAAARRSCEGRSAWLLEGGYDLRALGAGAATCVRQASLNS
ncbi:MAG: histone deacetylase [Candidatus Dormibacteraeota bacterium]|nr:histone deacetylase [Candidatus Dormibacteraeota bacterium]